MIRVLVVEDSPAVREFLVHVLNSDPDIHVVGTARDGKEAVGAVKRKKPDVVTMDIHMPRMNGLDATRRIMETQPTPIIIVSGSENAVAVARTFRAMEAGALAVLPRPQGLGHADFETTAKELLRTVKLMSEVKVVTRRPERATAPVTEPTPEVATAELPAGIQLVAIGASTGGPLALQAILSGLPAAFPVPVVIVQHIASGFTAGLTEWLAKSSARPVHLAQNAVALLPGHTYVAPEGFQMAVTNSNRLRLSKHEKENGMCPSVSYLLRSVAKVYGASAIGVLLSGMGKDGADALKTMRDRGAVTIVQDRESSVVHGMPGVALELKAAKYVLSPDEIAAMLGHLIP